MPVERRASPRVWVNEVVRFERIGNAMEQRAVGLLTSVNCTGLFIRTRHSVHAGARLDIEFDLPGLTLILEVVGEVVSVNAPDAFDGRLPMGLGVRFIDMDRVVRTLLDDFLRRSLDSRA